MHTFVIGDIHGCPGPLCRVLEQVRPRAQRGDTLVLLGDLIDRGPYSREVIEAVLAERQRWPGPVVALKGNHEATLVEAMRTRNQALYVNWLGTLFGHTCVHSYGVQQATDMDAFAAALPADHRRFLEEMRPWYEDENAIYVHGGMPRGGHPSEFKEEILVWTQSNGINYRLYKPVVYGHVVQRDGRPLDLPDKIGLDTGCGVTNGPLTAVMLPEREFFASR
jgi:serine/threonine protein phosphatase 1